MTSSSTLRRERDQKLFKVIFHSHWSDIKSDDGETDRVKWLWGAGTQEDPQRMIGYSSGETYVVIHG